MTRASETVRGGSISMPEIIRGLLARSPAAPESSVEITRNAKGDVQFTVTIRDTDPATAHALATTMFNELCVAYPRGES